MRTVEDHHLAGKPKPGLDRSTESHMDDRAVPEAILTAEPRVDHLGAKTSQSVDVVTQDRVLVSNALDVCQQVWVLGRRHSARSPAELSSGWCGRIESRPIDMRVYVLTSHRRWPRRTGSRGSGTERRPHLASNWSFYR